MRKYYPQRLYLFLCYGTLLLLLSGAFFTFVFWFYSENVYNEAKLRLENTCDSICSSVESALDDLSAISMNTVYSESIRSSFAEFSEAGGYVETRPGVLSLYRSITSMIGVFQSASQVNLYNFQGEVVGTGYFQRAYNTDLFAKAWYWPTLEKNGHRYISPPFHSPTIPAEGENQESRMFVSYTRVFFDRSGEKEGIVEVIQDCHKVFSLISTLWANTPDMAVYVWNERGEQMYPYDSAQASMGAIGSMPVEVSGKFVTLPDGAEALLTSRTVNTYDWTVLVVEPKNSVYGDLYAFRRIFLLIVAGTLLLTMVLCFAISHRLTKPLNHLASTARSVTLDKMMEEPPDWRLTDSSIREIQLLYQAFSAMQRRLADSVTQAMLSHAEEVKAKFQATQSMLNPHFLYNSLTTISVMSEEGMNADIVRMCQLLCDYFRYVSATDRMLIPLEQELLYTEKFIACMQIRFGGDFVYEIRIDDSVKQIPIPKLIVQPIVENAFKHAFTIMPPWRLSIRAYGKGSGWYVDIEDNGGGLPDDRRERLLREYKAVDPAKEIHSSGIGGMGLKNVYLRLKMFCGEDAVFRIDNTLRSRTIFTIGGPVVVREEIEGKNEPV